MKECDSLTARLNAYETIVAQLSSQGMTIEEELCALVLLSGLPPSWETFVTTIYNASSTAMTYASMTGSIRLVYDQIILHLLLPITEVRAIKLPETHFR